MKTQERYILKEKTSICRQEIFILLDKLRGSLKSYQQAIKSTHIPLLWPKYETASILSDDNLFAHCYKDIPEQSSSYIRLFFRFQQNNKWVFSIKEFDIHGDQLTLAEIVNINHHENYSH